MSNIIDNGKVMIVGDVHGEFDLLTDIIKQFQPDIILQTGDFGYWPNLEWVADFSRLDNGNTRIYWCDGNHEDHFALNKIESNEISPNVFYIPRGDVITINDKKIMFIGGADSVDKNERIFGVSWFPEELINYRDMDNILKYKGAIDIIISHTCPSEFPIESMTNNLFAGMKNIDPSRKFLSLVLTRSNPSLWVFGHWHTTAKGKYQDTTWVALNHISSEDKSWMWLEEYIQVI